MFTGIVQGTAKLVSIDEKPNFRTHVVELPDPVSYTSPSPRD